MQGQINGLLLNEIINLLLLLIVIVLFVDSVFDRRFHRDKKNKDFSLFLLYLACYLGCLLIWLPFQNYENHGLLFLFSAFRVFCGILAYSHIGCWLISIIEEKQDIHSHIKHIIKKGVFGLFALSLAIYFIFRNTIMANIPIFLYYILLEALVVFYHRSFGKSYTCIMTLFIIPTLLLQAQEWWIYTPANIYLVLMVLVVFSRVWIIQKEKHMEEQRLNALQQAELENVRTRILLSQIKPHFIYNTLGTISFLCEKNPQLAKELSLNFSDYLRGNLSSLDSDELVPLSKEMEHVKTYLKIEGVRFGDILRVEYHISSCDFKLPVLSIEPLVENAVKHGICKKETGGTVSITTCEASDYYVIIVKDDGIGFDIEKLEDLDTNHIGLVSVRKRIEILCGGRMEIESKEGTGTIVTMYIPKKVKNG